MKKVELGQRNYFVVHYENEIEWEKVLEAEILANQIIQEERPVTKTVGSKEEIKNQFPHLRVRWDRITDLSVTVVEVEGFDWAACVGDHVSNTRDIEYIIITRITSKGKGYYEIEFEVAEPAKKEALKRAALAREISGTLKTSLDSLNPTVNNLKKENTALTSAVRELTAQVIDGTTPEIIKGISVYMKDISGGDHKTLQKKAAQLARNDSTLVIFIEQIDSPFIVIAASLISVNCTDLIRFLVPEGKGGGNPAFVTASSASPVDLQVLQERLRQFLKQSEQ